MPLKGWHKNRRESLCCEGSWFKAAFSLEGLKIPVKLWIDSHQTIQLSLSSPTSTELLLVVWVISGISIIILNLVVFQDNNRYRKCTFSYVAESKMRFQCLNVSVA